MNKSLILAVAALGTLLVLGLNLYLRTGFGPQGW